MLMSHGEQLSGDGIRPYGDGDAELTRYLRQATYLSAPVEEAAKDAITVSDPKLKASIAEMEDGLLVDITPPNVE